MKPPLKAALGYFGVVFGAGVVFGTARVLWLAPQIGVRAAELLETPVMVLVMVLAARAIVRRTHLEPALRARLTMGAAALALMLLAEFGVVLPLRGGSLGGYFANLDPVSAAAYYGALVVLAALPLFAPPAVARPWRAAAGSAALVLAVMATVVYGHYRLDLAVEQDRVMSGGTLVATGCGPIEYAEVGTGPAVLLVHGAGGGYDQMLPMARELAEAGFRAITVSRFGYLGTRLPEDASPAAQADAHACLLDALRIERAAVLGASAGAPSSMQLALRHPQRVSALVLLVPLAYAPRASARPSPFALFMLERAVRSDFLYWSAIMLDSDVVVRTVLGTPPALLAQADINERARAMVMMRQILPLRWRTAGLRNDAAVAATLERYELERIAVRTLIISAQDDLYGTYASSAYTAQHVPGARFVSYRSGGHVLLGHHADTTAEVAAFLDGRPKLGLAR